MRQLNELESMQVSGSGFHLKIDLGAVAATCAVGIITAGPIGVGYCLGGIIVRHGVNELVDLVNDEPKRKK